MLRIFAIDKSFQEKKKFSSKRYKKIKLSMVLGRFS
ncbi:hypothetical protein M918_08375 [Clostridium sp. BL8]|nr:hypothetical protein M918_08375 [Clostridium sp. BL8]